MKEKENSSKKIYDEAVKIKNEGNKLFTEGDYQGAIEKYYKVIDTLPKPDFLNEEEYENFNDYEEDESEEEINENKEQKDNNNNQKDKDGEPNLITLTEPKEITDLRAVTYNNLALCFIKLGNYSDAIPFATKVLLHPGHENNVKALFRRALCEEKVDKLDEALSDYKTVLKIDPSFQEVKNIVPKLEETVKEKHEKEKKELIGISYK